MSEPSTLDSHWQHELDALAEEGLLREAVLPQGRDFTSNDYFGFSKHPAVVAAAQQACHRDGVGAGAARLLRGELPVHQEAEREAAAWLGTEAALLFPSGFQANLALLGCLPEKGDRVYTDRSNHASLIDGARAGRADVRIFPHNDVGALRELLQRDRSRSGRRWVVTERVFSMEGDRAPIEDLLALCEAEDAWLLVDEAHAAGLLPPLADHPRLTARILTGGKVLGVSGGIICGSHAMVELLRNRGRSFIYTTATPPPIAAALAESIRQARRLTDLAHRCLRRAQQLRGLLHEGGLQTSGEAAIVSVNLGEAERALTTAAALQAEGFDVRAVRPPTVPHGTSRLRIVCHADHCEAEIDSLAHCLLRALGLQAREPRTPTSGAGSLARPWIVAGTDTGAGKTVVSALLALEIARRKGTPVYLKPIQTGDESDTETVRHLAELSVEQTPGPLLHFPLPASPDQAAAEVGARLDLGTVLSAVRETIAQVSGPLTHLLLEGAGGLRVPWNESEDQLDFFARLDCPIVLAARSGLGTLNHTLLSLDALRARGLPVAALIVVGEAHPANLASLRPRLQGLGIDGGALPCIAVPAFQDLRPSRLRAYVQSGALAKLPLPQLNPPSALSHA